MSVCAKCHHENPDHYKFCMACGSSTTPVAEAPAAAPAPTAVPVESTCPQCASRIAPGQRFCSSCGARAADSAAPATEPGPVAKGSTDHGTQAAVNQPTAEAAPAATEAPVAPEAAPEEPAAPEKAAAQAEPVAAAPPAVQIVGKLVLIKRDGSQGEVLDLVPGDNVVGRDTPLDTFRTDEHLSPKHAIFRIEATDGAPTAVIEDQRSLNGVYVRTQGPTELVDGDMVRIGQGIFRFERPESFPTDAALAATHVGTTPPSAWGRLARISGAEYQSSNAYLLWKPEHTLGRERGDFTFSDDGYVSGLHARIFQEGGRFFIEDLRSSNGTYFRIKGAHTLGDGALLLLGKQPFRLQLSGF